MTIKDIGPEPQSFNLEQETMANPSPPRIRTWRPISVGESSTPSRFPTRLWSAQHVELIQAVADSGAGVIVRGGVARGEPGAGLGNKHRWASGEAAGLDDLLDEGETRTEFLLRFTNAHPGMNTNIVGTMNVDHLKGNIAAASRPLPADTDAEAKSRLDGVATDR